MLGGFGLTEPGAGSDAGGTATAAVDKGDHYVLNGSKVFITHAGVGEIFVVHRAHHAGPDQQGHHGVHRDQGHQRHGGGPGGRHGARAEPAVDPGRQGGKKEDKMGWRASDTRELLFEDAVVPKENVLGEVGKGFMQFLKTLDSGRIGVAALSLGLAEGAYEEALKYTSQRKQFGRYIAGFQGVHFALADMAAEIEAGKLLTYHAAWLKQHGKRHKKEAAIAKLFCSELAMRTTIKAVQLHGGYGYTTEYPVERMMRDAKVGEIGEGTSEVQRLVIAREILGDLVRD